ncbi:MAG: site-specific DNA-methyltransferase, partial [Nitrosomonas sp.]|nr:site-specific DNA-methyltransferase [Nitrosomonas sp.]MBY0483780.1 site-specific DNA-methyltransferase [Nitrosomonas sp.]
MAANEDKTAVNGSNQKPQQETLLDDEFSLELQEASPEAVTPRKSSSGKTVPDHKKGKNQSSEVLSYRHDDKRTNNPHVGMVDTHSDGVEGKTAWQYDPHIDPALNFDSSRSTIETLIDDALASGDKEQMQAALEQLKRMQSPYLNWSGKAERTSFSVDTVSLHVHERIDPATILAAVQKKLKDGKGKPGAAIQPDLFHAPFENLPLREAIDFYKHDRDWANRLIAGDSLLVMNSLLQKEGMAGQVQMIYLDPPYGIKYGSNFQPFVNKRDVKDR